MNFQARELWSHPTVESCHDHDPYHDQFDPCWWLHAPIFDPWCFRGRIFQLFFVDMVLKVFQINCFKSSWINMSEIQPKKWKESQPKKHTPAEGQHAQNGQDSLHSGASTPQPDLPLHSSTVAVSYSCEASFRRWYQLLKQPQPFPPNTPGSSFEVLVGRLTELIGMKKEACDKKLLPECPPTSPCLRDLTIYKMKMAKRNAWPYRARSSTHPFCCLGCTGIWDGLEIRDLDSFFQHERGSQSNHHWNAFPGYFKDTLPHAKKWLWFKRSH